MLSPNLILGYVNKDVNILLSCNGLIGLGSLGKSREGIKYSTGRCMRSFFYFLHFHGNSKCLACLDLYVSILLCVDGF